MTKETKSGSNPENVVTSSQTAQQPAGEISAVPEKRNRVWEVDFVRGLMILFVVWDHLMYDVCMIGKYQTSFFNWLLTFATGYENGVLRATTHDTFVALFVFTSGVSCSFSRNNLRRAIKMIVFAILLTAATSALSAIVQENFTIRFNVIHVIAFSVLLWCGIDWIWSKCGKDWQKNLFGWLALAVILAALVVGYCAKYSPWKSENSLWFWLAQHKSSTAFWDFTGGDYLPFLPDFGWFLTGAFLGKVLYRERKTLFPSMKEKYVLPVTFCGRYSLWIYFGSQIVMYAFFYLFGILWKLL